MLLWSFRAYQSSSGRRDVAQWYADLSSANRAAVYRRLWQLRQWPREKWRYPHFRALHGECSGLGEVRIKLDRVQWRPIGFFGPRQLEFTFLLIAREKDRKFIPKDTCSIGQARKAEVVQTPEKSHEWFLDPQPD